MDPRRSREQGWLGLGAMIVACSIWGLGPIWIRNLLTYLPAVDVCMFRVTLGAITLAPSLFLFDRGQLALMLRKRSTWFGGLAIAINMLAYAASLNYIRPAEVNLMFQANILVSALLGLWLYRESIPARRWWAFALVLIGVAMVILAKDAAHPVTGTWVSRLFGFALGLTAGAGASFIQAAIRNVSELGVGLAALVPMHLLAGLLFALATGFELSWKRPPDAGFVTYLLLIGVVASGVGSMLVAFAVRRISLAQAGVTGSMQPVVTILATALMGELLPPLGLVGAVLVVGGVVFSALLERHVRDLREVDRIGIVPLVDITVVEPPPRDHGDGR